MTLNKSINNTESLIRKDKYFFIAMLEACNPDLGYPAAPGTPLPLPTLMLTIALSCIPLYTSFATLILWGFLISEQHQELWWPIQTYVPVSRLTFQ